MGFIKKNYLIIIFVVLIIVIVWLTIIIINSTPLQSVNTEREFLKEKIKQDSIDLIDITANYIRFKEFAESKQQVVIKYKKIYIEKQDSVAMLNNTQSIEYFDKWTKQPVIHY